MKLPLFAAATLSISLFGQDAVLNHARNVSLDRAATMPNFVVDEVEKRYLDRSGRPGAPQWNYLDTLEAEVTIRGIQVSRRWTKNGERAPQGFWPITGSFGAELEPLFSPDCPTTLTGAGHKKERGKMQSVYAFRSPADGCFGFLHPVAGGCATQFNAPRNGRILVDDASGLIVRYEEHATDLPAGFGWVQRDEVSNWEPVTIGESSHWLPVSAEFIWHLNRGWLYRVAVEYKNHRHFESASNITYK